MTALRFTLLLLTVTLFGTTAAAQVSVTHQFDWDDQPQRITWEGETQVRYQFKGALLNDELKGVPEWLEIFKLNRAGTPAVEVLAAEYESFQPLPGFDPDGLIGSSLQFATTYSRQPDGWTGKVSCIPIIRTAAGYQRLTSLRLRIEQEAAPAAPRDPQFATESVLRDGSVYRMAVPTSGVYRLSYGFIKNDLGVSNLDDIDPRTLRLYGNPGGLVAPVVDDERTDDLRENAVWIEGEADGKFNSGDYLLFYAEGPDVWTYNGTTDVFSREVNIYDTKNYYYLKVGGSGNGLRISSQPGGAGSGGTEVTSFDDLYYFGEEKRNILHEVGQASGSGQSWYGEFFRVQREKNYANLFRVPNLVAGEAATVRARMALRSSNVNSRYQVVVNGQSFNSSTAGPVLYGREITSAAAKIANLTGSVQLDRPDVTIKVDYPVPAGSDQSEAWLDYLQLRARTNLRLEGSSLVFRDTRTRSLDGSLNFVVKNADAVTQVWRISSDRPAARLAAGLSGSDLRATASAPGGRLETYVALRTNGSFPARKPWAW